MAEETLPPTDGKPSPSEGLAQGAAPASEGDAPRGLFGPFVVFPLAIVIVLVSLYLMLGLLTQEERTAKDYLNTIRTGGINSRWQAAYELVKVLAEERREGQISPGFVREMIRVYEASRLDDPRVQRYLIRAMEMVPDSAVVSVLIGALDDPDDETRIFAIMSLRTQGDARAVHPLIERASSDDAGIRKAVVYTLGQLKDPRIRPVLVTALQDRAPDVRWNAALQLARTGDNTGLEVLGEMLNREFLQSQKRMSEEQRIKAMVQAIRAVGMLNARSMAPTLQALREADSNLKVRQAAIEVLKAWGG